MSVEHTGWQLTQFYAISTLTVGKHNYIRLLLSRNHIKDYPVYSGKLAYVTKHCLSWCVIVCCLILRIAHRCWQVMVIFFKINILILKAQLHETIIVKKYCETGDMLYIFNPVFICLEICKENIVIHNDLFCGTLLRNPGWARLWALSGSADPSLTH